MQIEIEEPESVERVAALDVGKAEVVCCVRLPGPDGRRMQEVRTLTTMTAALLGLGDWLARLGVTRVVMEATSDYWRAPFYLLEDRFQTWLVNAHDVKHLPGRPKTDRLDAVWLCKVAERQRLRPSCSTRWPPPSGCSRPPVTRSHCARPTARRRAGDHPPHAPGTDSGRPHPIGPPRPVAGGGQRRLQRARGGRRGRRGPGRRLGGAGRVRPGLRRRGVERAGHPLAVPAPDAGNPGAP